ncbi:unnamed protein product [marine sediment metagenome]|uniref:Uncharacterized protein n=1 Tax=marine sediment metagenome TaxID=412755 RepID=X1KCE9_9ZZZZ
MNGYGTTDGTAVRDWSLRNGYGTTDGTAVRDWSPSPQSSKQVRNGYGSYERKQFESQGDLEGIHALCQSAGWK